MLPPEEKISINQPLDTASVPPCFGLSGLRWYLICAGQPEGSPPGPPELGVAGLG